MMSFMDAPLHLKYFLYLFLLFGGGEGEEANLLPGGGDWAPERSSVCFLLMGYDPGNQPPGVWLSFIASLKSQLSSEKMVI